MAHRTHKNGPAHRNWRNVMVLGSVQMGSYRYAELLRACARLLPEGVWLRPNAFGSLPASCLVMNYRSMVRSVWRAGKVALILGAMAVVVYVMRFAPMPVVGHTVAQGEIVAEVLGTGTLESRVQVTISPKISGRIEEILADQGDRVTQGQPLVQLDDDELRQQVEIAQASLDAAKAGVKRLETDRDRATAVAAQAAREHHRLEQLVTQNASSQSDFDKAVEAVAIAEAGVARAEAAIAEGQQQVTTAEKTLAYQQARLADSTITVPFDGLIVRRQRDPGDVVVPGSPILQLVALEQLWISAWIDETEMARVAVGQPARIAFRSEPERSYPGSVTRLGREADRETREFVVDVQVLELPTNWAVGQRAEVFIETARKQDDPQMPANYVCWQDARAGVFVDRGQRAVWTPIKLGLRSASWVEIVEGPNVDDRVVMPRDPQARLADGKRIALP